MSSLPPIRQRASDGRLIDLMSRPLTFLPPPRSTPFAHARTRTSLPPLDPFCISYVDTSRARLLADPQISSTAMVSHPSNSIHSFPSHSHSARSVHTYAVRTVSFARLSTHQQTPPASARHILLPDNARSSRILASCAATARCTHSSVANAFVT